MIDGTYLGAPPVRIWEVAASATWQSLMRGAGSYGRAAGLGAPLAMPQLQPGLRGPANPQSQADQVALYPLAPSLFKRDLRHRFG